MYKLRYLGQSSLSLHGYWNTARTWILGHCTGIPRSSSDWMGWSGSSTLSSKMYWNRRQAYFWEEPRLVRHCHTAWETWEQGTLRSLNAWCGTGITQPACMDTGRNGYDALLLLHTNADYDDSVLEIGPECLPAKKILGSRSGISELRPTSQNMPLSHLQNLRLREPKSSANMIQPHQ